MKDKTETKVIRIPKCDFCEAEASFDGQTNMGPWAFMCDEDFKWHGVGLGTGRGQRLVLSSREN